MIVQGRAISPGRARGTVVMYPEPFSFLGGVDGSTGRFNVMDGEIGGKVFVFPNGKGSTVGSYVIYDLKVHGHAPLAIVNRSAETIVTTGAVISDVPMVDGVDISLIRDGDVVSVNGDDGTVDIEGVKSRVLTMAMVVCGDKVLTAAFEPCAGRCSTKRTLLTSYSDGDVDTESEAVRMAGAGKPVAVMDEFMVRNRHSIYVVHAYLFKVSSCDAEIGGDSDLRWTPVSGFTRDGFTASSFRVLDHFSKLL